MLSNFGARGCAPYGVGALARRERYGMKARRKCRGGSGKDSASPADERISIGACAAPGIGFRFGFVPSAADV